MRGLNTRAPRIAGLLALALGAVALLALTGSAAAKDRRGDDHGHHGRHHHHHHQFPMREAGTISSFDATTGKLTIALTGGESVTGLVTEDTRIECEGVDDRFDRRDHGGDDNGGRGDDNGGHVEPGDDHGGRGNEPGDDNGGGNSGSGGPGPTNGSGPGPSGEEGMPVEGAPAPEPGEPTCTVASLVPGTIVGEAELRLEGGAAVFEEVELGHEFDHDS
jgi:hypothetical protein